jgi:hypothetical protein
MKRFFNQCARHRPGISLLAAGVLPESERNEIEKHLVACVRCRELYEETKSVTWSLANYAENFPQLPPSQTARTRWANAVLAAGGPVTVFRLLPTAAFHDWWREVFGPWRRVWAGLAVVWAVILVGNFSLHDHAQAVALKSSRPSQEIMASFSDQQEILAELLADRFAPREVESRKTFSPKPRTGRAEILLV